MSSADFYESFRSPFVCWDTVGKSVYIPLVMFYNNADNEKYCHVKHLIFPKQIKIFAFEIINMPLINITARLSRIAFKIFAITNF